MTESEGWPGLAGQLTDFGHVLPVRVYFEDTDFSGVVYHASYLRFLERGRSDFLRLIGVSHQALATSSVPMAFAVARLAIEFRKPARIDDVLKIESRVVDLGAATIRLAQTVRRDEAVLASAAVSVVLINSVGRPRRIPEEIAEKLRRRSKP
jgi:acyl-CoA thioester hydrolase